MNAEAAGGSVLVHLASGVGNIVLATPLLLALSRHGFTIDLLVDGDYPGIAALFEGWSALRHVHDGALGERPHPGHDLIVPAIPPFYWNRYRARYAASGRLVARPPDALFYEDEQGYYLDFARRMGCAVAPRPSCFLPAAPDGTLGVSGATLALAPGCKTGIMAAKRWPHFPALAERFEDVVILGVEDDLRLFDESPIRFPGHVRSLIGRLSLRETAGALAAAGAVVANDSGLGHVAAAVGTPTILLFGPTPNATLGRLPANVQVFRAGLPCEPCWYADRLAACRKRVDCLAAIGVEEVAEAAFALLTPDRAAT